jgi:hypothetical protein
MDAIKVQKSSSREFVHLAVLNHGLQTFGRLKYESALAL